MTKVCTAIKFIFASVGSVLSYYIGGMDGFLYALIALVTVDYITGVMNAVVHKKLSSAVGFKGIFYKVLIFALVGVGNILDTHIIKQGAFLRTAVIFYYIANEGISIIENASSIGLPIPKKLTDVLIQLKESEEDDNGNSEPK